MKASGEPVIVRAMLQKIVILIIRPALISAATSLIPMFFNIDVSGKQRVGQTESVG